MPGPLAATIEAANESLLVNGNDAADRFFAPGYVAHGTGRDLTGGPDAVRRFVGMLHGAFSNLEVTVDILAETADRVAWQRTLAGTQSGSYMGFPATGRRVVWRDMIVSRFVDGVIAEDWVVTDLAERLLLARKG
jgi:predicted ester cyclase